MGKFYLAVESNDRLQALNHENPEFLKMKTIKFRIWSQLRNNYLTKGMSLLDIADDGGSLEWPLMIRESGNVFEQYTGVNDINEKEIYEGDIVKYNDYKDEEVISPVIYFPPYFGVLDSNNEPSGPNDLYHMESNVCVIGNIHENPELLQK